jgi:CubicO group peptidase (beta-lactamase class C family)
VKNRAYPYSPEGSGGFRRNEPHDSVPGPTNLYTSVEDLAKWMTNLQNGTVGGRDVIRQMHEPGVLNNGRGISYAFGLILGERKGLRTIWHNGAHGGFTSYTVRFPDRQFAIVLLTNFGSDPRDLAMQAADVYLGHEILSTARGASRTHPGTPMEAMDRRTLGTGQLAEFTGTYHSDELDTSYTVMISEGDLVMQHRRLGTITLAAVASDQFTPAVGEKSIAARAPFQSARFTRAEDGRITELRLSNSCVRDLRFEKAA